MKKLSFLVIVLCTCVTFCNQEDTDWADGWVRDVQPRLSNVSEWRRCTMKGPGAGEVVAKAQCGTAPVQARIKPCGTEITDRREALRAVSLHPGCIDAAIEALKQIPAGPEFATAWSDLSAAYYVRAQRKDQPSDFFLALDAVERALAWNPRLPAALFNRALTLEMLGPPDEAVAAWETFIRTERSPWADEARGHRDDLIWQQGTNDATRWKRNQAALPAALGARDRKSVARLIAPFPSAAERYFEEVLLPKWAEFPTQENLERAVLFAAGLSARLGGDPFPADVMKAIAQAARSPRKLSALREGHRAYLAGRMAEQAFREHADILYQNAAALLAAGASPLRLRASLGYAVSVSFAQRGRTSARQLLTSIEQEAGPRGYQHLGTLIHRARANFLDQGGYMTSLAEYKIALAQCTDVNDAECMTAIHTRMGGLFRAAGDRESSWRELFYANHRAPRLIEMKDRHACLDETAETSLAFGHPRNALSYQNSVLKLFQAELASTPLEDIERIAGIQYKHVAIVRRKRATIELRLGDAQAGLRELAEAIRLKNTDPHIAPNARRILNAGIEAIKGQALLQTKSRGAIAAFTDALELTSADFRTIRAFLLVQRAEAKRQAGRVIEADEDLRAALTELHDEEMSLLADRKLGSDDPLLSSYFSRFQETYRLLIRHLVENDQPLQAFVYAERARAIEPLDLVRGHQSVLSELDMLAENPPRDEAGALKIVTAIQKGIPPDTFLIQYCVLDDRTYAWVVSHDKIRLFPLARATRQQIEDWSTRLHQAVADRNVTRVDTVLRAAYEDLAAEALKWIDTLPAENLAERRLVFIPDRAIHGLPLAALREAKTGRYVFERFPVEISGSAALYQWSLDRNASLQGDRPTLLAIGDPAFDQQLLYGMKRLPRAEWEAREICKRYASCADVLIGKDATVPAFLERAPHFDIVHFAGHAIVVPGSSPRSFLVLAPSDGRSGTIDAEELLKRLKLARTRLVVLSTCSSAGGLPVGPEGVAPLVRSVLGAGVPSVVGSLWAVDDATTEKLMVSFHRHYEESGDAAKALQAAQRESLRTTNNQPDPRSVLAWAPFQVIGHASSPFAARAPSHGGKPLGIHSSNSLQRPDRLRPQ